jgi:galactokinase/mevalonate kinase-like predicted kinase
METLLSVPSALVPHFHALSSRSKEDVFVTHDPLGSKLGSGGGTAHLVVEAWKSEGETLSFEAWSESSKRLVIHAGGQSRRLPAYAPSGKSLIPVPVFRWMSGQRINQTLLDLQSPLLQRILDKSPDRLKWLISSGDTLVWFNKSLPDIPDVDVLCVGSPASPEIASGHGVFFTARNDPSKLQYMLQKPSPNEIASRSAESLYLVDVGIWLLSTRAMLALMQKSGWKSGRQGFAGCNPDYFDLYSDFGLALGENPTNPDSELSELKTGILSLPEAEFYHFGRNSDLIHSSLALQNRVQNPQRILSPMVKPHPAIFIQNSSCETILTENNENLWIENSSIGNWELGRRHVLTGIPKNAWRLNLRDGICIDIIPTEESSWIVRPYGFDDSFRGSVTSSETQWMGQCLSNWCQLRSIAVDKIATDPGSDIQTSTIFPLVEGIDAAADLIQWMIDIAPAANETMKEVYLSSKRFSADHISDHANLNRLFAQQKEALGRSLPVLAGNFRRSVFHQMDLDHLSRLYADTKYPLHDNFPDRETQIFPFIRDSMFRSNVETLRGGDGAAYERQAFNALRDTIVSPYRNQPIQPQNEALSDQVIWSRSPIRLDLAGGWTDTPPYCFLNGGRVVNLAVELNGQPPIQVFLRVSDKKQILIRSIDLGVSETIETFDGISQFSKVGSGFSIPKAALALAGFHPDFNGSQFFPDLKTQLEHFGGGIEITLLCAIPKGSGLGTSSILAATILGGLSDLCGLGWDKVEIAQRTLVIEQILTTGGGWQDQYGGILHGVKQLETIAGLNQIPKVHWLPDHLFTDPNYTPNLLLYYTGITRVAKDLLGEIVRGMFLNKKETLYTLNALHHHAADMHSLIQAGEFGDLGRAVRRTWLLNQKLDSGTNTPDIERLIQSVDDLLYGGKLLGAGGGGYLLMLAKDAEAALRVRRIFKENPPNGTARFVKMSLSKVGLQTTRS